MHRLRCDLYRKKRLALPFCLLVDIGRVTWGARPVIAGRTMLTNTAATTVTAIAITKMVRFFWSIGAASPFLGYTENASGGVSRRP